MAKRKRSHGAGSWIIPALAILVGLPFIYNSCSQMQPSTAVSSSANVNLCQVMLDHNKMVAVRPDATKSPFYQHKALLAKSALKLTADVAVDATPVPGGSRLTVILNNACIKNTTHPSNFLSDILNGQQPHPALLNQAYAYVPSSDSTAADLDQAAQGEPCVVGVSWEHKFKTQSMTFNDPSENLQTQFSSLNAISAYSLFYNPPYGMSTTTKMVKVAVVDTGIDYTHPDLAANIWKDSGGYGVDATTLGSGNVSYDSMDVSPVGHGTHVSGIVGAVSNNGIGIIGTMPFGVQIMPVKIFAADSSADGGVSTTTTYFYNGIEFAIANGADVINISADASGTDYDAVAQMGLQDALNAGIPVVVAMGNGSPDGELVDGQSVVVVPAIYATMEGVIGVASYNANTQLISDFSNYSTTYAEIAAPGALDVQTGITSTIPVSMSSYGQLMGTSQSTPMVSAAAALTIGWIKTAYGVAPIPSEVERLIKSSAAQNPYLADYVQGSRQLDLQGLANTIMAEYPRTQGIGPATLPTPVNCN